MCVCTKYLHHTLDTTIAYKLIMFGFDIYERLETLTYEVKPTTTHTVEHLAADKRGICRLVNISMVGSKTTTTATANIGNSDSLTHSLFFSSLLVPLLFVLAQIKLYI